MMENIIKELKKFVDERGFEQEDKRLNRKVRALPGHLYVMEKDMFNVLKKELFLKKYVEDWKRIYPTFRIAVKNVKEDKNSRRLLMINDYKFSKVYQCFTHCQFVYTHRDEFDMYVYMRSSDLDKFKDDCVFFANLAKKFENRVLIPVTKLVIVFGHLHYEIKTEN